MSKVSNPSGTDHDAIGATASEMIDSTQLASKTGDYGSRTVDVVHKNIDKLSVDAHLDVHHATSRAHSTVDAMERTVNRAVNTVVDLINNAAEITKNGRVAPSYHGINTRTCS